MESGYGVSFSFASEDLHLTANAAGTTGQSKLHIALAMLADRKMMRRKWKGCMPRRPLSPAGLTLRPLMVLVFEMASLNTFEFGNGLFAAVSTAVVCASESELRMRPGLRDLRRRLSDKLRPAIVDPARTN